MPRKKKSDTEFYRALGETIKNRRMNAGFKTLTAFSGSASLGLKRGTMSGIENGKQQISAYQLYLIAESLNTTIDSIVGESISKWRSKTENSIQQVSVKSMNDNTAININDL